MADENNPSSETSAQADPRQPGDVITPELVSLIADRVYAWLVDDLRIDRERQRRLVYQQRYRVQGE
jgi:hypothetical protein